MKLNILTQYHFPNLSGEQLEETLNFDAIEDLPDTAQNKIALELLSQFLVGNIEGTFDEIKTMEQDDRRRLLQTWAEVLKEPQELQKLVFAITKEVL